MKKHLLPSFLLIINWQLSIINCFSQVQLVKDINTSAAIISSYPGGFINMGGVFYFNADDGSNGNEFWKSDGTANGTKMVKDICPGSCAGGFSNAVNLNGTLFFVASDGSHGAELWTSDGTAGGTVMVKDINPGSGSGFVSGMLVAGNTIYFQGTDGVNGNELWKSDGTAGGTVMVKDIYPGATSSNPSYLAGVGSTLFFEANDGTNGYELWKSDGTTLGTVMVKDIYPGSTSSAPNSLINVGGTLYFVANDGTTGSELWKSNGTTVGTTLVKDIYTGINNGIPFGGLVNFNGTLVFVAYDGPSDNEIWKSDGTTGGTVMVKDINPGAGGSSAAYLTVVNSILFFRATDGGAAGIELWLSDGTAGGTALVKDIYPGATTSSASNLTNINGILYFEANDGTNGSELWRSDGTLGGTVMIKDIYAGITGSSPSTFIAGSGFALFRADNNTNGIELWKSDGTTGGTILLKNIAPDLATSGIDKMTAAGTNVFFLADDGTNGPELWKSDGTTGGTSLLKDINPGAGGSGTWNVSAINNIAFFDANNGTNGDELWKSDGTTGGTVMVKDIIAGSANGNPEMFTNVNNNLFFYADQSATGSELWKSDGTTGGTALIKDILTGTSGSIYSYTQPDYANINGKLYFPAFSGTLGAEPWLSDGTSGGTQLISDIWTCSGCGSNPGQFTYANGTTFFYARTGSVNDYELWKTDGTSVGTVLVKDIWPGTNGSWPYYLTNVNNTLFFQAGDGTNGVELWKSDGTTGGTVMVKDIYSGANGSNPSNLVNINGTLFFTADDGINGPELWKSNGTTAGTVMVKDIYPGSAGSSPSSLVNFHDTLFFSASDDIYGAELWTSTGTASGTKRVSDIYSGAGSSTPDMLTADANTLFFRADDGIIGRELWKLTMPSPITDTAAITNVSCNGLSDGAINLTVSGGTSPYTFLWSNGATTQNISGLMAGTYTINISDAWGWTHVDSFAVMQPAVLSASLSSQTNVTCNGGNNGAINISVSGGTTAYTFLWSNNSSTQNVSGLIIGNYSVLVTDAHGCTQTFSTTITQPPALAGTISVTNVSCNGGSNGTETVNMTVGVSPFTYLWNNSQTTQTATGLAAGTYSVLVTDFTGCTTTFTAAISQPNALSVSASSVGNPVCDSSGMAKATAMGGTGTYTYFWSSGQSGTAITATGLSAGNYTITVEDANGCTSSSTFTMTNNPPPAPAICSITVDSLSQNNEIIWDKAQTKHGDTIFIYRDTANNAYGLIGKVSYDSLSWFIDTVRTLYAANGDPNVTSWRYKLAVKDSCGNTSAKSPYHQSIFMYYSAGTFQWSPGYEVELQPVPVPALQNYLLQRDNISNGNYVTIQTLSASSVIGTDPQYATYQATATWRVITSWTITCTPTIINPKNPSINSLNLNTSRSNIYKTNNPIAVSQTDFASQLIIYPNPTSGLFTLEVGGQTTDAMQIEIYNTLGQKAYSASVSGRQSSVIDLRAAPSGIYFLQLKTAEGIATKKLIISAK